MYRATWNQKPPLGTPLDTEHPWCQYLDLCLPFAEGQGAASIDAARGVPLSPVGTGKPSWIQGPAGALAPSLSLTSGWSVPFAGQYGLGVSGNNPTAATENFTLSFWLRATSIGNGFYLFNTGPYNGSGWALLANSSGCLDMRFNAASDFTTPTAIPLNTWHHWTVVRNNVYVYFYLDGQYNYSYYGSPDVIQNTAAQALYINCYYGGSMGAGYSGAIALDNVQFFKGIALGADQVQDLHARPWQLFARRPTLAAVPTIAPTITATPGALYANGANQAISLLGYDRSWTPGSSTTFSLVAPPAGVSIASQSVSDATHASVTIATGTASGTVGITDGVATASIPVQAVSFAATPATVPANHAGHITLTLAGSGTLWQSGTTTFSLASPPAGVAIVSQSIASATSATLTVTTGAGTGTLTISDGVRTATAQVATATLAASSTTALVGTGTYTLSLAGTGTVWTQETPSTLFSVAGLSGASLSNIHVSSDTAATATLTLASKLGGSIAATDASTGAASGSLTVVAVPSGSVHATGRCTLSSGVALSGKTAASLAFRFLAESDAGISGSGGTAVLGFSTGGTVAAWSPSAQTLTVTLKGTTGTFTATVPVLLGIGYHFLLSWQVGSQPSFTGTLNSAAWTITGIADTSTLVVGDLLTGTGLPAGTTILKILDSHSISISNSPGNNGSTVTVSVTRGTQVLYLNGVAHTTQHVPYPIATCSGLQFGGDGGSGVALDHEVSDVAAWGSYAATSSDAIALTDGTSTPLQVDAPLAWWPLGGGTVGATPTLADSWLGDFTPHSNALSVAAGTLSGLSYAAAIALTSPVLASAHVTKGGKLAIFGAAQANTVGGQHPPSPITAVSGTPTIYRNGSTVQIGSPVWFDNSSGDNDLSPFVGYLLGCGAVQGVNIPDGGEGYTSPTVTAAGVTFGTPVLKSGVTSYQVAGASGYAAAPSVLVSTPANWMRNSGTGMTGDAAASCTVTYNGSGGFAVAPAAGGLLGCGSGYSTAQPPTVSVGAGSTGAWLTATLSSGSIAGISIPNGGGGYPAAVRLNIQDPTGTGASATLTVANGSISGVGGLVGGSGYTSPTFTITPVFTFAGNLASGSTTVSAVSSLSGLAAGLPVSGPSVPAGATIASIVPAFTGTLTNGSAVVTGIASTASLAAGMSVAGSNIPAGATIASVDSASQVTLSAGATGGGTATISVLQLALSAAATASTTGASLSAASTATVRPVVSQYIAYIPVNSSVSTFNAPPTLTVTDSGGTPSRAATLVPIMSGPAAGDAMTYDAPAGWITPTSGGLPLGGLRAVTGHAMDNWTGQREHASGGLGAFAITPTMLAGANVGSQPSYAGYPQFTAKNHYRQGANNWQTFGPYPGTLTRSSAGDPVSWNYATSTLLSMWCEGPLGDNALDSMGFAGQFGPWTLRYDDPNANTPQAMAVWLGGGQSQTWVNQAGSGATATATISGGAVTALTLGAGGSGYQAAIVQITGGGGKNAVYTAQVQNGAVVQLTKVCGGSNYTSAPAVTVVGVKLSGQTVTAVFDLEPGANPTSWAVNATIFAASPPDGSNVGHWTISNVWVVPPDATARQAVASIDATKTFATDDGVLAMLTGPSGRTPGVLRFMDVTQGYGGVSNYVLPSDLQDPTLTTWSVKQNQNVWFQYARRVNTNPGDSTYPWSSTKIYGPQALFTQQDPSFSVTADTTAGSTTLANVSAGLMGGASVSGPGIPAGAYVVQASGATGVVLSAAATATATGASLTVANPGYLALPTTDNGHFLANSGQTGAVELRSTTPHGLVTGRWAQLWSSTAANTVPFTNAAPFAPNPVLNSSFVWVTGPYTVIVGPYIAGNLLAGAPSASAPQVVDSTSEIDLTLSGTVSGWQVEVQYPAGSGCVPYEYAASMEGQLPGCVYWLNIPRGASDALIRHIAQVTYQYLGPTNPVWLEYHNEIWNGFNGDTPYFPVVGRLLGYVPAGTTVLDYYTSDGQTPPYNQYGSAVALAGHAQKVFVDAWTAAGGDPARIKRLQGGWWNGPFLTQQILETAARWGIPVDYVHNAPYLNIPSDAPVISAFSPAGTSASAGSWPVDAINDFYRHWMAYSDYSRQLWQGHALSCSHFGEPQLAGADYSYGLITNTNATARALLTGTTIAQVAVGNGGSGYSANPLVTLSGGGGTYTSATATVSGGVVTGVAVAGSSGYTSVPTVLISDPPGAGAAVTVTVSGGVVQNTAVIVSGGANYKNPIAKVVTANGGSGAVVSLTTSGGAITGVAITSGGSGYPSSVIIQVTDQVGSGATATASLAPTSVGSIVVTRGGSGYQSNATVSLSTNGGPGSGSSGWVANVSGGSVASITGGSGGSGYTAPPAVTITGGGGTLPSANFYCYYTFVDGQGRETTVGLSQSSAGVGTGDVPAFLMPPWPSWAQSMNVYLTTGAPGSETLFATVPRSQYGAGNAYPVGSRFPLGVSATGWPNSARPPAINQAAANNPSSPGVVCYEGGATQSVPNGLPFLQQVQHDTLFHPSARDVAWAWYAACQQGGAAGACWYQLFASPGYGNEWAMAWGTQQPAGDGLGSAYAGSAAVSVAPNNFATIQGAVAVPGTGVPDGHPHVGGTPGNTSPTVLGFRDFFDSASPGAPTVASVTPASAATRVATGTAIAVTFSEAMSTAGLTLTLTPSGGSAATVPLSSYDAASYTATFVPAAALVAGTAYTASVDGSSQAGMAMASAYSWGFTTAYPAPAVASVTPANGSVGISTGVAPTATLSGAVGSATIAMTAGGQSVAGTSSLSGQVATFTPTAALASYTICSLTVTASAPDGTAMTAYSWSFTTQAQPPTVNSVVPANGATGLGPKPTITATFNEPINPASLSLTLSPSAQVGGASWDPGTLTATWTPIGSGLAYGTTYAATVSATELDGTTMTAPYQWSFSTHKAPPTGRAVVLAAGAQYPPGPTYDATGLSVVVTDLATGQTVPGTASWDGTRRAVGFAPASPFAVNTKYEMTIAGLKSDGAGLETTTALLTPGPQAADWLGGLGPPVIR